MSPSDPEQKSDWLLKIRQVVNGFPTAAVDGPNGAAGIVQTRLAQLQTLTAAPAMAINFTVAAEVGSRPKIG